MKHILFDFFLFSLGAGFGVVTICLMQAAKAADREIEMMESLLIKSQVQIKKVFVRKKGTQNKLPDSQLLK